jgi:uncharacterized membrane protein YdjX (TVP38/TMEM64 family)
MANSDTMTRIRTTPESGSSSRGSLLVRGILVLLALALLVIVGRRLGGYVPQFAAWVGSLGFWGPLVFVVGYAIATVAFIPGSLLTLAAGAIFGLLDGTLYVFVGATLGSALAFLVARYVARRAVERRLEDHPKFEVVDQAVAREGLKIVFLLRLSPAFPYNLLNYALGLTSVRFRDYFIASLGMIPATFLYVYYGKALGSLAAVAGGAEVERGPGYWAVLGVGLVATLVVTTLVTRVARRALKEEVDNG